jgi:hypothetical protein
MRLRIALASVLVCVRIGYADCIDPTAVADARAAIDASCDCASAATHHDYVRCAARVLHARFVAGTSPRACARAIFTCARRSTCGRPGAVACCRPRGDAARCSITRDPARCVVAGGCASPFTSCCDACAGTGCATTTTSTSTSTTTTSTSTTVVTTTTTSTTIPVTCGNGVVDPGEQCDAPLAFCDAACRIRYTACCDSTTLAACYDFVPVGQICDMPGETPHLGRACSGAPCFDLDGVHVCPGGTCVGQAIPPTSVCCQAAGSCVATVVASTEDYVNALDDCFLNHSGTSFDAGTCGSDGVCVPPS